MTGLDFTPNGKYWYLVNQVMQKFFSKEEYRVEYVLANCTILCYVMALVNNLPAPTSTIPSARNFHTKVANGWKAIPYQEGMKLKANDIIEWGCNHVAYAISDGTNPQVVASWWTNYDGTSKGDRNMALTKTMEDTANYLYNKYPYRYYHQTDFQDEQKRGGGKTNPTFVLRLEKKDDDVLSKIKKLAQQIIDLC